MFQDPPQKKGYYSDVPTGFTFNKWAEVSDYNYKVGKLNDFLERKERAELNNMQRSFMLPKMSLNNSQIINLKKSQVLEKEKQSKEIEKIEKYQRDLQQQLTLQERNKDQQSKQQRLKELQQQIQNDKNLINQEIKENQLIQELMEQQSLEKLKLQQSQMLQQKQEHDKIKTFQNQLKKQTDLEAFNQEQKQLDKMFKDNQSFYKQIQDKVKNADYSQIYPIKQNHDAQDQENIFKYWRRQIEEEEKEIQKKKLIKDQNLDFLKKQIENNWFKKELLQYEEQKAEFLQLQERINKQEFQEQSQREEYEQKLDETLEFLKLQIELKKDQLNIGDHMTVQEAKINCLDTQKIDLIHPSHDLVAGLPGFYWPCERVKQINIVKNNFEKQIKIQENFPQIDWQSLAKKRYCDPNKRINNQKEQVFKEYNSQYIKQKLDKRPFDIISGNIKQTTKF